MLIVVMGREMTKLDVFVCLQMRLYEKSRIGAAFFFENVFELDQADCVAGTR